MHTGKSWSLQQLTFISLLLQALRNHFIAIPLFIYEFFFSGGGGEGFHRSTIGCHSASSTLID